MCPASHQGRWGCLYGAQSHPLAAVLSFLCGEKGEEVAVCFANIYPKAPVQCSLVDTIGGFLDPVGCSGGVFKRIPDCQVVCM